MTGRYIEFGKCDYCGKETYIKRKYFYYNIKCDCHSPRHFELRHYCEDCEPRIPHETKVTYSSHSLLPIED